jgi:BirA family transcriptional regulator, biotin operon repressor / biotin---[acetyl-CoA-carboxylase] ligase
VVLLSVWVILQLFVLRQSQVECSLMQKRTHRRSLLLSPQKTRHGFKMSLVKLLEKLADGQFHSGDELGVELGVSRTAIWKQIKKVGELGLSIESVKGRGYRLEGGLDLLSKDEVVESLSEKAKSLITELDIAGVVDSTNTLAMGKAMNGAAGYVCAAEQQSTGRGRRGRQWVTPYAGSIALSIVWESNGGVASLEGLSLAVGVAVVDALSAIGVDKAELKWPNDVLHGGKKLAGVLIEIAGDAEGPCRVVIGVGLNVSIPPRLMLGVDQPWTDVSSIVKRRVSRSLLLAILINELMDMLSNFAKDGFTAYRTRWQSMDAFAGENVSIKLGEESVEGRASGVDESGAIIIETDSGPRVFNGGEVSLRLHDNAME